MVLTYGLWVDRQQDDVLVRIYSVFYKKIKMYEIKRAVLFLTPQL